MKPGSKKELKYGYVFHRKDGWYPLPCDSDNDAIRQAKGNPGTIKVTVGLTDRLVWEAPTEQ